MLVLLLLFVCIVLFFLNVAKLKQNQLHLEILEGSLGKQDEHMASVSCTI